MSLYPLPTELPTKEAFDLVIKALRGEPDLPESAHAVWVVAGYALAQWDKHPPVVGAAPMTSADAASLLSVADNPQAVIPWTLVLPVLLELLLKILKR